MTAKLTQTNVKSTLFRMAYPMLAGTIAINAYNFADTWFVAQLGIIPLAAMGLTFPVIMIISFVAGGIGNGITALMSHDIGRKDQAAASRIVTHGIILVIFLSVILSIAGYLTMEWLFVRIGADNQTLPYVRSYMHMWYAGVIFTAFPMMGNGILISLGDSKYASLFMLSGAALNCILDPVLIFGWLGFPALGIFGAALATVIALAFSSCWLIYLLTVKYRLLTVEKLHLDDFLNSCRRIMIFAIPGSLSMILIPLSLGVITALVSSHGNEALAAFSAAGRVEMVAFVIPMALGMSLMPFTSQNFGASRIDRICEAKRYSTRFAFLYGILVAVLFYFISPILARIFTDNPRVTELFSLYIRIVAFGYGMMEVHRYCGFILTGIHRPFLATAINIIRIFFFLIPFSFLGNTISGLQGIFIGRLITDLTAGTIAFIWVSRLLKRQNLNTPAG